MREISKEEFQAALGDELRRLRDGKGWSQTELAIAAGIHRNSVFRYEAGADIPVMTFYRLCVALGARAIDVLETVMPDARQRIAETHRPKLKVIKRGGK